MKQELDYGKKPPQAVDLEEGVLGVLMTGQDRIYDVINFLRPDAFYKPANQKIYEAILRLHKRMEPIDTLSITEDLRKEGVIDAVGGPHYISKLTSKVSTLSNVEYHARIVYQKYLRREVIRRNSEVISMAFDESIDEDEVFNEMNMSVQSINEMTVQESGLKNIKDLVIESLDDLEAREKSQREGRPQGIPTGLTKLTQYTNGWQKSDLVIIGARPSMGKTAIMLHFAKEGARQGHSPLIFSCEMSAKKLTDRLLIGESQIDALNYRNGILKEMDWSRLERAGSSLSDMKIYVDDKPFMDINYIHSVSRVMVKKGLVNYIFIDYLQLIKTFDKSGRNREQEVAILSKSLKGIARELNIPVILFVQLNRKVEEQAGHKRPELWHLRESGAIEQDADIVMLLYRAEKYGFDTYDDNEQTLSKGLGELIIAKFREGPVGTINWRYNNSLTKISDDGQPEDGPF